MKNLLLIALLMLGLMFNGCASKSETGINQENSMSFGADLVQSGNPIGMAIGGLVMLLTVDGLEQTDMKEQYNRLSQERLVGILADVCRIEDTQLRLSLIQKLGV